VSPCAGDAPVRFQYNSTYLVEGLSTGIRVLRETGNCAPEFVGCPFYVDYHTENAGNSAITGVALEDAAGDYLTGAGTLFFGQGQNEKTIYVTGIPQPAVADGEADEFFYLVLSNPRGVTVSTNAFITGVNPYAVFILEQGL